MALEPKLISHWKWTLAGKGMALAHPSRIKVKSWRGTQLTAANTPRNWGKEISFQDGNPGSITQRLQHWHHSDQVTASNSLCVLLEFLAFLYSLRKLTRGTWKHELQPIDVSGLRQESTFFNLLLCCLFSSPLTSTHPGPWPPKQTSLQDLNPQSPYPLGLWLLHLQFSTKLDVGVP